MFRTNSNYLKTHDRYLHQGQEMDDEVKGEGNSVNFEYRMHDPRLGRFFAIDPLASKYPWYTPYQFSGNKVISHIELEGLEEHSIVTPGGTIQKVYGPLSETGLQQQADKLGGYISNSDNPTVPINQTFFCAGAGHDPGNTGYITNTIIDMRMSGISNPTDIKAHSSSGLNDALWANGPNSQVPYYEIKDLIPSEFEMEENGIMIPINFKEGGTANPDWRITMAYKQILQFVENNGVGQTNLVGYSAGSVVLAQAALMLANEKDVKIDNLVLIGTTISSESKIMKDLLSNPLIGKVWSVEIPGDCVQDGASCGLGMMVEGDAHPHFMYALWPDAHYNRMRLFSKFINQIGIR